MFPFFIPEQMEFSFVAVVSTAQARGCLLSSHSLAGSSALVGSALWSCMWDVEGSNTGNLTL